MASKRSSLQEVLGLADDVAQLQATYSDHDSDSHNGDGEEADCSQTTELVPVGLLRTDSIQKDELALEWSQF